MGALFIVDTRDPGFTEPALAAARAQFAGHRLTDLTERKVAGWQLIHAPHILGGPESFLARGDDFVAVAGTLTVDGQMGAAALAALLDGAGYPEPDWSRIGGQFVAAIHRAGRTVLFTDYFAAFQLFRDTGDRLFSTSMLAAAAALRRLSFDPQGVYEFAFNVVPVGDDTVFSELKLLGPEQLIELAPDGVRTARIAKPLPAEADRTPLPERIAIHRARIARIVRDHVAHFGERVYCPLSGGLDSRLVLAALRAEGVRPHVFVYGSEDDEDVRIARRIAQEDGFAIEWRDKQLPDDVTPDAFPEIVERNFQEYDALPNFGELFENGSNGDARDARHRDGAISASGGCGEVFRNFFFLPDRPIRAATVAASFFARFAMTDVTGEFDARRFLRAIEDKILAALREPGNRAPLPRLLIEQAYPRVRCRSLFGKEISIEGRHGAYLMPFLDHNLVAEATRLPLAEKNAGRFEAALLAAIDPHLAAKPSAYGHAFDGPPSRRHRFDEWSTRVRPAWVRRASYPLRRRMGPMADEHGGLFAPEYMGRVIDLEYPAMRRFFHPERITDSSVLRRVSALEYLAKRMGGRLTV